MDASQISQSMRAQMLQQSGVSADKIKKLIGSGHSFTDIIMMLIANTQTAADLNGQFPIIPEESGFNSFDFSEDMLNIDPAQLSGLFGFVMTGNQFTSDNSILNSICDGSESSVNKMNAFDFVNQHIENGELEILSYTTSSENSSAMGSETADSDIMDFIQTMREARENMSGAKKADADTNAAEIGALQNEAERLDIRFNQINSEIKMKNEFESPETQLLKGVEENLKQGKSEFTVKLKPEGLGEIIVKLVQNDGGKMIMSMTASSARTAELLNSNLASLQSSLNQHNVEIVNPHDMTNTVSAMSQAFEQYYHDGGQHQRQQDQHFYSHEHGLGIYSEVDDDEAFELKALAVVGDSELNIMI